MYANTIKLAKAIVENHNEMENKKKFMESVGMPPNSITYVSKQNGLKLGNYITSPTLSH